MNLLKVLACPYCKTELRKENNLLICKTCSREYLVKNNISHLYDFNMEHWSKIMKMKEEALRRCLELPNPSFDDGRWLDRVVENTPLSQRANKAMFNVAIDFFGDDLYNDGYGLDMGCGQGWASAYLSRYKPMIALDVAEYMCGAIPTDINKGIDTIIADGQYMPFLENSMDIVFSCAALHHIHNQAMGVREIFRILKPSGKYFGFGDLWTNEMEMQRFRSNPVQMSPDHPEGFDIIVENNPYCRAELYSWFDIGFSKMQIQTIKYKPHMHEFGYLNIAIDEDIFDNLIIMGIK